MKMISAAVISRLPSSIRRWILSRPMRRRSRPFRSPPAGSVWRMSATVEVEASARSCGSPAKTRIG